MQTPYLSILLVVKFGLILDQGFHDNLTFYKKLFGNVFDSNMTIVLTGFKNDDQWRADQELSGDTVGAVVKSIKARIVSILALQHDPVLIGIDALLPKDCPQLLKEQHKDTRVAILNICAFHPSYNPIESFPKPQELFRQHEKDAKGKEQLRTGIEKGYILARKEQEQIIISDSSQNADWSFFPPKFCAEGNVDLKTDLPITRVDISGATPSNVQQSTETYRATLHPEWGFGGLKSTVRLYTEKRHKYKDLIVCKAAEAKLFAGETGGSE